MGKEKSEWLKMKEEKARNRPGGSGNIDLLYDEPDEIEKPDEESPPESA